MYHKISMIVCIPWYKYSYNCMRSYLIKMTIIYITENNTKGYGVTFQNNGYGKAQKLEDVSENKNIIYKVNPMETFLGKSQLCDITEFSGAEDKEVFNGNTILLEVGKENNNIGTSVSVVIWYVHF